jgi:hypothetical protein
MTLVILHPQRMRHIILSSVACPDLPYIPHYLIKGMILRKKITQYQMCVLILSTNLSKIFLILRRIQRDIVNVFTPLSRKFKFY